MANGEDFGQLYVVPIINAMGPVTDPKHQDLLNTWQEIDHYFAKLDSQDYRMKFPDSQGRGLALSYFVISWSGFKSNPVKRDFGWHTIYDYYAQRLKTQGDMWRDGIYWMYNHPPASGVGNEWGLDWQHNSHYFNILNRMLMERNYFPAIVEVVTERNDTSHFLEQWFPYDFGNRNALALNLNSVNADGRVTGVVIDWRRSPHDWSQYHPNHQNYQIAGGMNRTIFRLVDIKSIVYELEEAEIEKAFARCLEGHNTVLAAYEHDFRERSAVIMDRMIEPIHRISKRYPEVKWHYANALEAAQNVTQAPSVQPIQISLYAHEAGLRVSLDRDLFGPMPYVAIWEEGDSEPYHLPISKIGHNLWQFPRKPVLSNARISIAATDPWGNVSTHHDRILQGQLSGGL